jgi:tetratricopeptide (TPR) repeat protein
MLVLAFMLAALSLVAALSNAALSLGDLERTRDKQDIPGLERAAVELTEAAGKQPNEAAAQYKAALAQSYLATVAMELRDKEKAKTAAEAGIQSAERAVKLNGSVAEYHRILGTLCGQVIPANVMAGLKYGRCAQDSIKKAIELDGKSAMAYVSRGVGNYYLPSMFGGGTDVAIRDFQKAIELDPKLSEAHLWMGIALRKANRNEEARKALARALELNPHRVWAKQQLEKTPAK